MTWWGSRPIIQGIVGSWVGRVTVSAAVRVSMSNKFQHVTGNGNDTNLSRSAQEPRGNLWWSWWSRVSRKQEEIAKAPTVKILLGALIEVPKEFQLSF